MRVSIAATLESIMKELFTQRLSGYDGNSLESYHPRTEDQNFLPSAGELPVSLSILHVKDPGRIVRRSLERRVSDYTSLSG